MEGTVNTEEKQDKPWLFKKGQSGNPNGRPKGSFSLKTYVKHMLEEMTDEQRQEFLSGIDKKTIWEMSEGKPKQDMEVSGEFKTKIISVDE
jgi:hypothetical protein